MKITEKTPLNNEWLKPREEATETVLYLYNTISHRFKQDPRYGDIFVEKNQVLIGQLVQAAMLEVNNKIK